MPYNKYLEKDEYSDRGHSQDRGGPETREWERERDGRRDKRDERYRDEKGSANDRRGRGMELSDRQQDVRPHSHKDRAPDQRHREQERQQDVRPHSHKDRAPDQRHCEQERQQRTYTETSISGSEVEYPEPQHRQAIYNIRYILTARGLCQIMEVFVNLLIVICSGVNYSNSGVYRDLASYGGLYQYYYGGAQAFTGADADRVKELDQLFNQLKLPPYIFSMACGGALMAYACVMLALGVLRVTYRWPPTLLAETLINFVIGLGYIPALAFYFIKLQETYDNPICKEREALYKSKGHQGFECTLNGADIAGGLFGVLGVFVFMFGMVLAIRAFRAVRETKKQRAIEGGPL